MKRSSEAAAAHRVKVRPVITSGRRLRDSASASAVRASSATSSSTGVGAGGGASPAGAATPTSSGRSRCTGPGGSATARAAASDILSATSPARSAKVALVRGRKSALWSMRIWILRPSQGLETLQVKASTGAQSSQAQPTPVVRLVAPGPTVAAQAPGTPVSCPTVVAMNPAEVSLAVSTNSTGLRPRASMSGSTGPLGMPKTQRTPACSSMRTMASTLVMAFLWRRAKRRLWIPAFAGMTNRGVREWGGRYA